ncbi:MAG: TetR/AcrR family transcriptional regulator [Ignavibacteriae bacterium]|nr:TetR/AcrR family transcriptional regulator [Ignavibacteriota bacterium]
MQFKERENIIFNLVEVQILRNGITSLNISELCKDIGMSKKTFYKYYSNKEKFLSKFFLELLKKSYLDIILITQKKDSFFEKFEKIMQIVQTNSPFFNQNILSELKVKYPEVLKQINNFKQIKIFPLFTFLIKNAQKHNIINKFEPKTMLHLFFSIISSNSIINTKIVNEKGKNEFTEIFQILLKGVLTKKAKNFLNKC